jgi:hypothetical protein
MIKERPVTAKKKKKKLKTFIEIEKVVVERRMLLGETYSSCRCASCGRDLVLWANYVIIVRNGIRIESESVCGNCISLFTAIRHPSSST